MRSWRRCALSCRRPNACAGAAAPTEEELDGWQTLEPGVEVLAGEGARPADASAGGEFYLRTLARAAVDVNGIHGGEPDFRRRCSRFNARANVSIRLAPGQDVETVAEAFEELPRAAAPHGAELTGACWLSSPAGLVPPDAPPLRVARDAFERVLGRRPLLLRTGGTLPIVPALAEKEFPPCSPASTSGRQYPFSE